MLKYRVTIHADLDQILEDIRRRHDPDYPRNQYPSWDFDTLTEAEEYAFAAGLATGRNVSVRTIQMDEDSSLLQRLKNLWGEE